MKYRNRLRLRGEAGGGRAEAAQVPVQHHLRWGENAGPRRALASLQPEELDPATVLERYLLRLKCHVAGISSPLRFQHLPVILGTSSVCGTQPSFPVFLPLIKGVELFALTLNPEIFNMLSTVLFCVRFYVSAYIVFGFWRLHILCPAIRFCIFLLSRPVTG